MKPDFEKHELIPAIIQDSQTQTVLMLGYMNEEAFRKTEEEQRVTFFSRSKNRLWTKGETSGNFLNVVSVELDCDKDTLLYRVNPVGPVCHTGTPTCFGEKDNKGTDLKFLSDLIHDRKLNPKEGSYTNSLLNNIDKAAQKVGEEAVELVIEAKDERRELFLEESADLMYHYLVLLEAKGVGFEETVEVLRRRFES